MMLSDEAKKLLNDILKYFMGRKASDVYVPEWSRPIEEFIAKLEAEISDVNNLLVDYAMSIYPHGGAPEWPTISQGVKYLVDYAKALDKPAKSGAGVFMFRVKNRIYPTREIDKAQKSLEAFRELSRLQLEAMNG